MIRLAAGARVMAMEIVNLDDKLRIQDQKRKEKVFSCERSPLGKTGHEGKSPDVRGIAEMVRTRIDKGTRLMSKSYTVEDIRF